MNKQTALGYIASDIIPKNVGSSILLEFSVATTKQYTNKNGEKVKQTTFLKVKSWNKQAEVIAEFFDKGDPIYIEGETITEEWQDKETGAKRTGNHVSLQSFSFVPQKKRGDSEQQKPQEAKVEVVQDDEIPF